MPIKGVSRFFSKTSVFQKKTEKVVDKKVVEKSQNLEFFLMIPTKKLQFLRFSSKLKDRIRRHL